MGKGNMSAIINTVIVGHFLSSTAKIKGMLGDLMEKKSKKKHRELHSVNFLHTHAAGEIIMVISESSKKHGFSDFDILHQFG